jgi:hypothetical protein
MAAMGERDRPIPEPPDDDDLIELDRRCLEQVAVASFVASPDVVTPSNPESILSWRVTVPRTCGQLRLLLNGSQVNPVGSLSVRPRYTTSYALSARAPMRVSVSRRGRRGDRHLRTVTVRRPYPPVPVKLSVTGIQCFGQEDSNVLWPIDHEDDEPYVLCSLVNVPNAVLSLLPPRIDLDLPRPRVVKIGPWEDVDDEGELYPAPPNAIWDRDSGTLASRNDALFIAALVEQDNSDPETVRGTVESLMVAKLLEHTTSATNRNDWVRRMVDSMSWAVGSATTLIGSGGVIDPDDRIGPAQELALSQLDLDRAFSGGESRLSLPFRGDDADYTVHFAIRPDS